MALFKRNKKEDFKRIEPKPASYEEQDIVEPQEDIVDESLVGEEDADITEIKKLKKMIEEQEKEIEDLRSQNQSAKKQRYEFKEAEVPTKVKVLYDNKTKKEIDLAEAVRYLLNSLEE